MQANEMVERVGEWRELAGQALSRTVCDDRITTIYPSDERLLQTLRQLIAAEADCCTFLKFTVSEGPVKTVVELAFPPEARPLIESMM